MKTALLFLVTAPIILSSCDLILVERQRREIDSANAILEKGDSMMERFRANDTMFQKFEKFKQETIRVKEFDPNGNPPKR